MSYRVVQWATGNIGTKALKGIIEHPDLELAGVLVYDEAKAGRDAGSLAGVDDVGVIATADPGAILELDADCVIYMPRSAELDDVCALLASGKNVVTTCGEFIYPRVSLEPADLDRVEAACAAGRTSIHATGSSPGFITEALPVTLTSIQRRLDSLTIEEHADMSQRPSPELLFEIMGFGRDPKGWEGEARSAALTRSFGPSLQLLADTLGIAVERVEGRQDVAVATEPTVIAAGRIEVGQVAAQRTTVSAIAGDRPIITFRAHWYCTEAIDQPWTLRPTGWHCSVRGDAPLEVNLRFPLTLDQMAETTPGYTANRAVNAVPFVCDARPGPTTSADLPALTSRLG